VARGDATAGAVLVKRQHARRAGHAHQRSFDPISTARALDGAGRKGDEAAVDAAIARQRASTPISG
jgi:hypothetical protein